METLGQTKTFYAEEELPGLYPYLDGFAHQWLQQNGLKDQYVFSDFCKRRNIAVFFPYKDTVFMLDSPIVGFRCNLHILSKNKRFFLEKELHNNIRMYLHTVFGFKRIEVYVADWAGHAIRRHLRDAFFSSECVLKKSVADYSNDAIVLHDAEIWSSVV